MAKIFIAVFFVLLVDVLSASPIVPSEHIMKIKREPNRQRCGSLYSEYYQSSLNKTILNDFLSASKASLNSTYTDSDERKYSSQKAVCWNFLHKTLSRMEANLPSLAPCTTLHHEQTVIFNKFEAFLEFLCTLDRSEFQSFADVQVVDRLILSQNRVETCFDINRKQDDVIEDEYDFGTPEQTEPVKGIDFCSYNIQGAMDCTKSLFKDPKDLAGFEAYTNFFLKQFTCDSYVHDNSAEESFYTTLFDRKVDESFSFYGDFLTFIEKFFAN